MKVMRIQKRLSGWNGDARLYLCEPGGELPEFVVVSAVVGMYGSETYIFASDVNGEVSDFTDLIGSYKGGFDHAEALRRAGYEVKGTRYRGGA